MRAPGDPSAHLPVVPESFIGEVPDTVPEDLASLPAAALPYGPSSSVDLWHCELHGAVHPVQPVLAPDAEALSGVVAHSQVPLWLPWPLSSGWSFSGLAYAGDRKDGARATVVAASGPSPFGGDGDLLLIAEEMGIGLGARFAGLPGPDPGPIFEDTAAHAKLYAAGRPTPMWAVPGTGDRAVFVGEARGMWLWLVLWPAIAGTLLYDEVVLTDLRDAEAELAYLPMGTLSPRFFG
ncbi:hypothetical protein KDL01_33165 [Actinospica durhamensis]|uniref:Uncharacterized protein n=1 Tax=Actinospica durhamensis TaxID=1508375 RepID=A0A941IQX2_9ACTN|nr:DUF6758 family protein [Actinospica durhamensis]MBR7838170.1 hypothetical protein [Actinospica durhamensis]